MKTESLFVTDHEIKIAEEVFPSFYALKHAIEIAIDSELNFLRHKQDCVIVDDLSSLHHYQVLIANELLYFLSAVKINNADGSFIWKNKQPSHFADDLLRTQLAMLLCVLKSADSSFHNLYRIENDIPLKDILTATQCYLKLRAFELGGDKVFENFKEPPTVWELFYSSVCDCGFFSPIDKRCKVETSPEIQCAPCNIL